MLYSKKLFVIGDNSNKCKEEIDNNSETKLEAYYKLRLNKYKTNKQYKEALKVDTDREGEEEEEDKGETDFKGFIDFKGFLDSNNVSM
jgi:hypothetical protein